MKAKGLPVPFFDLAMGALFVLIAVVLISTVEPPKKATTENIPPKAEFLVTLEWDDGSPDDIDLYLRGPDGVVIYFSNRQSPSAFLDQDNLGTGNTATLPDGTTVTIPSRREVVTIRAIVPGEYVINAHEYRKHSLSPRENHLKMTLVKLNPFSEITRATAVFDTQGQEQTLANFTVAADGSVSSVFLAPVQLVGAK